MPPMADQSKKLIFVIVAHIICFCAAQCAPPIQIPIRNVTLSNQQLVRGVALSVGTPPQMFAFQLAGMLNNTVIYDNTSECGGTTALQCETVRGGTFDEDKSSTWQASISQDKSGASPDPNADVGSDLWGSDNFDVNSSFSLPKFPFAIARTSDYPMNSIGLGLNSTFLNALNASAAISSRTWGVFMGLAGAIPAQQMDGSLIIGGYDAAKVVGPNITQNFTIDQGCSSNLIVNVTDITMNLPNGSTVDILPTGIKACIRPDYPILSFSDSVWRTFSGAAGGAYLNRSYGLNVWGVDYEAAGVYGGNLTISVAGFPFTITNDQLVLPDYSVDSVGQTVIQDSNVRELLINPLEEINKNDMPILGQTFLTTAYLLVDNDQQTFTLWKNNLTSEERITNIGPSSQCPTPVTNPAPHSKSPPPTRHSMAAKDIAAIVVSILVIGILAVGAAWFWKRRNRKGSAQLDHKYDASRGLPELPLDSFAPQELDHSNTVQQTSELPGSMVYHTS